MFAAPLIIKLLQSVIPSAAFYNFTASPLGISVLVSCGNKREENARKYTSIMYIFVFSTFTAATKIKSRVDGLETKSIVKETNLS